MKKVREGDVDWAVKKEILRWILNSKKGTFQLTSRQLKELKSLLAIHPSQRLIPVSKLRSLIGKLLSMHLVVPGAIGNFFYIQESLTKVGTATKAYLSKAFHREISNWQRLCKDLLARPRFLADVVQRLPNALGFCDASGMGTGVVWIDPDGTGASFVWRVKCLAEIVSDLVTWDNPTGGTTNSDLELAALVLQKSCFSIAFSRPTWHAPMTGSDNTPSVSWCFREASTVNPIVADLLCVRAEMNSGALLTLPVFYQPYPADDASLRFQLPDNKFLSFFWSKYCLYQSAGSWTLCHPPTEITFCVISVLRRSMYGLATFLTTARPSSMISSENSVPQCRSSIGSMILTSQWYISFRCTATRSFMDTGISSLKSEQTWCLRCGKTSPRFTY